MVVHRRPKFRAAPESVARMEALAAAGRIDMVVPFQLDALEGSGGRLEAVVVKTLKGEVRRLAADVLLPFYGLSLNLGQIVDWGPPPDRNHNTVHHATCSSDNRRYGKVCVST